jgi:hypothetical protein
MTTSKNQVEKEISEVEAKVSEVCDNNNSTVDEMTGIVYPKESEIHESIMPTEEPKNPNEITLTMSFGYNSPPLVSQIIEQGYEVDRRVIAQAELIQSNILFLNYVGILKQKATYKAFDRLSDYIGQEILNKVCAEDEKAVKVEKNRKSKK